MVHFDGYQSFASPRDFGGRHVDIETLSGIVEEKWVFLTEKAGEQSYLAFSLCVATILIALCVELDHFATRGAALVAFVVGLLLSPGNLQSLEEAVPLGHGEAAASTKSQQEI